MRYDNQLRYAVRMIGEYDGSIPLAAWLKDFFKQNKQMGSRDRKTVGEMVYAYYRLGQQQCISVEDRILNGLAISNALPEVSAYFPHVDPIPSAEDIFPWFQQLSEGVDRKVFALSFLQQPFMFLRIRPGHAAVVKHKLNLSAIDYHILDDHCIALKNIPKLEEILDINKEVVIQDRSSQQTADLLNGISYTTVWDCCAASGGKSILVYDRSENIDLTVSDIRPSIIHNLKKRFQQAGILRYQSFIADLSATNAEITKRQYDLIIADVPCSGSGTWARTPEQLSFFKEEKIAYYRKLQEKIISRAVTYLKPGGHLLYLTCSVFAKENEQMVQYISQHHSVRLRSMQLFKGYQHQADTMFGALLVAD